MLDRIHTAGCQRLYDVWGEWRGERLLPHRRDVRLEAITDLLPAVLIVEFCPPDGIVIRLAGTAVCEAAGRNITGEDYVKMVPAAQQAIRFQRAYLALHQPCGYQSLIDVGYASGDSNRREAVALPLLAGADDETLQAITVIATTQPERPFDRIVEAHIGSLPDQFRYLDIGAGLPDDLS